mgnify:CR=1 FL=1
MVGSSLFYLLADLSLTPVVVGESLGHEVAITVTGLKPNHFYNIRVVAMGPNNFQAASPVIRLRTFGKDGKPDLGNARLPTNFVDDDAARGKRGDDSDDSDAHFSSSAAVESAPVLDNASNTREGTAPQHYKPPTLPFCGEHGPANCEDTNFKWA